MAKQSQKATVDALMSQYAGTFSHELGIADRDTPSALYQTLCFSILASARIGSDLAMRGTRALFDKGWTTARKLQESTWRQRVTALNRSGYARYDERTSSMLGDVADLLMDRYKGDLRKLREAAHHEPKTERKLLKEFKGIGEVGADIYCREVQDRWDELYPFVDKRVREAAGRLGLGSSPEALRKHVSRKDFPAFASALVRCELEDGYKSVREGARASA